MIIISIFCHLSVSEHIYILQFHYNIAQHEQTLRELAIVYYKKLSHIILVAIYCQLRL